MLTGLKARISKQFVDLLGIICKDYSVGNHLLTTFEIPLSLVLLTEALKVE